MTWTRIRKLYVRLERLRVLMSRRDPVTYGQRGRPRKRVEEIAMELEQDITREINRMTSDFLLEEHRKRCGCGRSSVA